MGYVLNNTLQHHKKFEVKKIYISIFSTEKSFFMKAFYLALLATNLQDLKHTRLLLYINL